MPGSDDLERVWRQKVLDELIALVTQGITGVVVEFATPQHVIVDSGGGGGGLTDAQLRATPVPVSGTFFQATQPVSGTFWQATQPISALALPLPAGAATDAGLAAIFARQNDGTQHTVVDNASIAVTGTFWQATQPVSIALPVAVTGTFWQATQPISAAALPLPAGAATEATVATLATQATLALIKAKTDNLDVALSTRAVTGLTDAQLRAVPVPVSGTVATGGLTDAELRATAVPVSLATLPALVAGAATIGKVDQGTGGASAWKVDGSAVTQPVSGTFWQATQPVSAASLPLPTGAATEATLATMLTLSGFQARINTLGQKTMVNSTPVVLSSDQSAIPVTGTFFQATQPVSIAATVTTKETRSATGTQTSVAGSAASVTLLASNANRLGASIYNDSTAILYVRFQATASTSNFSVKLFPDDFYEVPFGYTGVIDGIWASATGNARLTEYT